MLNAARSSRVERARLLRGALPDSPEVGCCSSGCYDCDHYPGHAPDCAYAALTEMDRSRNLVALSEADLDFVLERLEAAVPDNPFYGMCQSVCFVCYGVEEHEDDCGYAAVERAGLRTP